MENAYIDFQGGITIEEVRKFLRDEDSRESRALLSRLIEDKGMDDLMVTIADCLKEYMRTGINEDIVRAQLTSYSDS
jgi:transposase